ncbi:alkaline phosphatase [Altericroceibacterium spongiae]|uniref:Alkaline phosphatase n=1 Tax=Altericroceibacterium spongiae TaxID=2320269 RepID=A0A420EC88_9SPHN|nr:alkaline phosphatase D family protein [Altericroceibacterium spongiae]RKF18291.1 alkaline phosphatase [Altericroceibacterium spongiae]
MNFSVDRRALVKTGLLGLGALSMPGTAAILTAQGFTHGVASGEPSQNSVLLWTRYAAANDTRLRAELARDINFTHIVGGGDVTARGETDHTAKITIGDLPANSWLYYRFVAPDGSMSRIGRTRTLPQGDVSRFGIGLFSCSNMGFGWFNAYGHAAKRNDIDLMIHVGDYFYEYNPGKYPDPSQAVPGRILQPDHETVTLADYRLRYAAYRLDEDLQALHAAFPMIARWDDHESANDSWKGGAENHQPDSEGGWSVRKAAAERAYREWLPVSDRPWDSYQIGTLATIFLPETRLTARTQQVDLASALKGKSDIQAALTRFRDTVWLDPSHRLMGADQEKWLFDGLAQSKKSGTQWQILAQQVVMGPLSAPSALTDWLPADAPAYVRQRAMVGLAAAKAGLPFNFDSWDGYPVDRNRLYEAALGADADLIVLAGDSHNAWGNNLLHGTDRVGVEFAGHSVTSPGYEAYFQAVSPTRTAKALIETNPGLAFCDTSRRGYVSLDVKPDAVDGTWHFMSTIREHNLALDTSKNMRVRPGVRMLEEI